MPSASHLGAVLFVASRIFSVVIGSSKPIGLAFWLAMIALLSTLEALAHLTRWPVPSAGDLVAHYLHRTVLRAAAIAVWLYAGWHLFSH
jgi:antibiotic biosynthesis monooxygenase (ABM) superfamily enzyme